MLCEHLLIVCSLDLLHLIFLIMHLLGNLNIERRPLLVLQVRLLRHLCPVDGALLDEHVVHVLRRLPSFLTFYFLQLVVHVVLLNDLQGLLLKILVPLILLNDLVLRPRRLILVQLLHVVPLVVDVRYFALVVYNV